MLVCKTKTTKIPFGGVPRHEEKREKMDGSVDWCFPGRFHYAGRGKKKALMCGRLFLWFPSVGLNPGFNGDRTEHCCAVRARWRIDIQPKWLVCWLYNNSDVIEWTKPKRRRGPLSEYLERLAERLPAHKILLCDFFSSESRPRKTEVLKWRSESD